MFYGQKVYLRPIQLEDIGPLNRWKNNEEVFKFLGGGFHPISIDQHKKWIDNLMDLTGENKRFMICERETDNPVGFIGLYSIKWIHRSAEIGLYLGETSSQGKGYASEAYKLLERYSSNYLNLRKLKLNVVKSNEKAEAFWERVGFIHVGTFCEDRFIDGNYHDLLLMEKFI